MFLRDKAGVYIVDYFEYVREGSYYEDDIKTICKGNKTLENQFFDSTDAPLQEYIT